MNKIEGELPLVSVIIPTYNRATLLPETLDSVLIQTYKNWEWIIVDDGSTDNTEEIVQKYVQKDNRFRFYHRPEEYKPGANGARNYGLSLSTGEYIQWFDSDDIMLESFLSVKLDFLRKHPEHQSVLSRFTYFEGNREILSNQLLWNEYKDTVYENMMMWYLPIMTPCIMFRKQFLLAINEKYDESILRQQEFEFFSRIMIKHAHQTHFIDESLALVRRNNKNAKSTIYDLGNSLEMNMATFEVQNKLVELLIHTGKLSSSLLAHFYTDHKNSLSIAFQNGQHEVVKNYKNLIKRYLIYSGDKFTLAQFRLGYFLMRLFPFTDNVFLNYKHNPYINLFNKYISVNIKRIYKLLFVKGWLSQKIQKNK